MIRNEAQLALGGFDARSKVTLPLHVVADLIDSADNWKFPMADREQLIWCIRRQLEETDQQ